MSILSNIYYITLHVVFAPRKSINALRMKNKGSSMRD